MRVTTSINIHVVKVLLALVALLIFVVFGINKDWPIWLFFSVAPLCFLAVVIYFMHGATKIVCPECKRNYGVQVGITGWPTIPPQCSSCGVSC